MPAGAAPARAWRRAAIETMRREFGSDPARSDRGDRPERRAGRLRSGRIAGRGVSRRRPRAAPTSIAGSSARAPKPHLDLWAANRDQLIAAGVPADTAFIICGLSTVVASRRLRFVSRRRRTRRPHGRRDRRAAMTRHANPGGPRAAARGDPGLPASRGRVCRPCPEATRRRPPSAARPRHNGSAKTATTPAGFATGQSASPSLTTRPAGRPAPGATQARLAAPGRARSGCGRGSS